jgi:hypothetical protein
LVASEGETVVTAGTYRLLYQVTLGLNPFLKEKNDSLACFIQLATHLQRQESKKSANKLGLKKE